MTKIHNMGIVVASLDTAITFFAELGLTLEGRGMIEEEWAGRVTGLPHQRVEIAMMATADGNNRLEICRYIEPLADVDHRTAPVNSLGYLRLMFNVPDLDDTIKRLSRLGATLVAEVVNYENIYRLCYMRGPEGLLIGLAENIA